MTGLGGTRQRLLSLDHIRGLSVFGIVFVNIMAFGWPFWVYAGLEPVNVPYTLADRLSAWAVDTFAHSKFITLFSLLFGVSICLISDRLPEGARGLRSPLVRRLLWLLPIGLLHGIVIWMGDILLHYALSGLLFLRLRHWSGRRLIIWGAISYGLATGLILLLTLATPAGADQMSDSTLAFIAQMRSGLSGSFAGNVMQWLVNAPFSDVFYILVTLPLMMLGAGLYRVGFLKGTSPAWVYGAAIATGMLNLVVVGYINWMAEIRAASEFALAARVAETAPPIFISLAYASVLILFGRLSAGQKLLHPLGCAGRMAFTNYLTQSLILTALFYGGRFPVPEGWWPRTMLEAHMGHALPWYGLFNQAALVSICAIVVVVQLIFSTLWMQSFRYGPFEWVWRSLTQWRPVPITRQ